jgi:hypothetical protein
MRYKVPQNVQRADQILLFLTLKDLILLILGFGLSYMLFTSLNKQYELNQIEQILIWIPGALSAALAFVKIKGIPLTKFILLIFEKLFRPAHRQWVKHGGDPFVSLTTPFTMKMKKKEKEVESKKDVSSEKIKNLANILDGKTI